MLERNYDVHVPIDACTAKNYHERWVALESLRDFGCKLTTFDSLVGELYLRSPVNVVKKYKNVLMEKPKERLETP